jgi:hypothetical protein
MPPSSFGGTDGAATGGENPIDITSFLFFALMPGTTMLIAEYDGWAMIGAVLKPADVGLDERFGAVNAGAPGDPMRCDDGDASSNVSTTVGTVLAIGG